MIDLEKVGQGKTAAVYRDGQRAVKLYTHLSLSEVQREADLQTFAVQAGLPVPKVYGVQALEQGNALTMQYISGEAIIRPRMDKELRKEKLQQFVALQCRVHSVDAKGLQNRTLQLADRVKDVPHLSNDEKAKLLGILSRLDGDSTSLLHGDYHMLNILDGPTGLWIIDWVDAACGAPAADACRTYLLFRYYAARIAGMYLRTYCKEALIKQEAVLAWLPVVAAGRLLENVDDRERDFLLGIIREKI